MGPQDRAGRAQKEGPGRGIGRQGLGKGPRAPKPYVFHYIWARLGGFSALGRLSSPPSNTSQNEAPHFGVPGPGQEGPGRPGLGFRVPGKGPGLPNLTFSTIFEPGRAVSSPWRNYLLRPATLPRTFIFLRNFMIPASEPSNSTEISLFCCFQGHRLQGYPHQTLENQGENASPLGKYSH